MSEYVIMPKSHWQNACNAVRDGSGTTDLILSGDMATKIRSIAKGGITAGIIFDALDNDGYGVVKATVIGTKVPVYAFFANDYLTDVSMPDVDAIGSSAFNDCSMLTNADLPDAITLIGNQAFYRCDSLSLEKLPASLKTIGRSAFSVCTSLQLSELPEGLIAIEDEAFYYCTGYGMKIKEIPASVTTIGKNAFGDCHWMKELTFKGTPNSIASTAFSNCYDLTVINVPWAEGEVANAPWGATNATINYNYGKAARLISFTIDGTEYQAEEGMTWRDWVDSSYNTCACYIDEKWDLVAIPDEGSYMVVAIYEEEDEMEYTVSPDATIHAGNKYVLTA